ncbi:protein draper-like isoform X2 [Crassostrea angulata]|uniref:protein draper-like isoform X1 n=1 Tax=Magallana angulata TaxID=2784310 RepID=UPI0022B1CD61|nr:protein draper-like isoform X1 [Crassostrea angulata]XP_052714864.1 protein draper-like isoform X2 [Crassostrea angulata]
MCSYINRMKRALTCFLVSLFCIGGTQTYILLSTNFVAMPTPQNMTSLQSTACSVSGGFVKYSETINTFLPGQDFFYTQQNFDKTTKDFFRVSTAQCYQYPEIFFVLSTLLTECRMIRKKSYDTKNDLADRNATNIYFWLRFYEMDCTGVPFAKHLCVTCKSKDCSANVTCYVFAGECTGSLELNTNLIDDKDENGKSCKRGSKDGNCTNICDPRTYGLLCSSRCSRHCVDGECHHRNGTCLQGCTSGWKGDKCTEPDCPPDKYGVNCSLTCSPNCWSDKCDSEDGTCVCGLGWQRKDSASNDVLCNKPCEPGFYGYRCEEECGDCLEGTVCLPGNGTCPKGCNEPGFRISSDRCNYNQYDSYKSPCYHDEYGINCEKTCSPTCLRNSCRNTDGRCRNCPAGLKGFNCTTECSPGTFGENCNGRCRCDGGSPCDPVSGRCPGECEEGYEGETCSMKKCEPGLYGDDCDKWCFCKDRKPCDRRYGYCPEKECQKGWSLSSCDYRDTCLYTETAGPITWEPRSLGIGLALGFVGTFFVTGCGAIYRKFEKM